MKPVSQVLKSFHYRGRQPWRTITAAVNFGKRNFDYTFSNYWCWCVSPFIIVKWLFLKKKSAQPKPIKVMQQWWWCEYAGLQNAAILAKCGLKWCWYRYTGSSALTFYGGTVTAWIDKESIIYHYIECSKKAMGVDKLLKCITGKMQLSSSW